MSLKRNIDELSSFNVDILKTIYKDYETSQPLTTTTFLTTHTHLFAIPQGRRAYFYILGNRACVVELTREQKYTNNGVYMFDLTYFDKEMALGTIVSGYLTEIAAGKYLFVVDNIHLYAGIDMKLVSFNMYLESGTFMQKSGFLNAFIQAFRDKCFVCINSQSSSSIQLQFVIISFWPVSSIIVEDDIPYTVKNEQYRAMLCIAPHYNKSKQVISDHPLVTDEIVHRLNINHYIYKTNQVFLVRAKPNALDIYKLYAMDSMNKPIF